MTFKTDAHTDIGPKKNVNQDALLIKQAKSKNMGQICMACLCDGMGGLSCGEVASATLVDRVDGWFNRELPQILAGDNTTQLDECPGEADYWGRIQLQWNGLAEEINKKLGDYGNSKGIMLGTTISLLLIMDEKYLVMSIGDSRVYRVQDDEITQITHDHSYIQREMDAGRMTPEQALNCKEKSVLLQCIGASKEIKPDFFRGETKRGCSFLLCSDGLWRKLNTGEIVENITKKNGIKELVNLVKDRGETDNISGLMVRVD